MGETSKNLIVGAFVLAACALVMWTLLRLQPRVGDQGKELHALFSDINKINIGTGVNYAGRPVGEVVAIIPVEDPRTAKADPEGRLYVYEVVMKIDSSVQLFDSDLVTVATSGLLGEKSIALIPRRPKEGQEPQPVDDRVLLADSSDALDTVVRQVGSLAQDIGKTFGELGTFLQDNKAEFHIAIDEFGKTLASIRQAVEQMDDEQLFQNLPQAVASLKSILHAADQPEQIESAVCNISEISCNLNTVMQRVERGEGTIGALLQRDELYQKINDLVEQADRAIESINRYGLLFHNNKRWQRMQKQNAEHPTEICP
jgi:phospholipid/cholesterol/gamma-HCH transport system substrate-binding protein